MRLIGQTNFFETHQILYNKIQSQAHVQAILVLRRSSQMITVKYLSYQSQAEAREKHCHNLSMLNKDRRYEVRSASILLDR